MKLQYDLGLSRIYELVINSNPCYAFLLKGNSLIQNKLIVAHVLAHCDFFKNNVRFSNTSRNMVDSMAASAERIRSYEMEYGKKRVEHFLDQVLGIQEHIDPSLVAPPRKRKEKERPRKRMSPYDDLWNLDHQEQEKPDPSKQPTKQIFQYPQKDLLLFIMNHSTVLEEWQQDILTILRDEMLYFWPQLETKIMNEGWASYWHLRILRELDLNEEETVEFARLNASVTSPSSQMINPYHVGLKIFEDIEKRWDHPTKKEQQELGRVPGQGREKIFEVRELDSDTSFLRNYLTKELVEELDLYVYHRKGNEWSITDKDWKQVRDQLITSRINGGYPYITIEDGDFQQNGELYLKHHYEEHELDLKYMEKTLPYVYSLWGRPVHLETVVENRAVLFSYDGHRYNRRYK